MKKVLAIILTMCMLVSVMTAFPLGAGAAGVSDTATGTSSDSIETGSKAGQVLYVFGDSIPMGYGVGYNNSWAKRVIDLNGYDAQASQVFGEDGLGFCKKGSIQGLTYDQYLNAHDFGNADIVVVALGVNDWKEYGAMMTTYFAGLDNTLKKIRNDNPDCDLYFLLPFNVSFLGDYNSHYCLNSAGDSTPGACYSRTLGAFCREIKAKFEEPSFKAYRAHVLDMTQCRAINRDTIRDNNALPDKLHPSAAAHVVLADEISQILSSHGNFLTAHAAGEATCTATGNTAYWSCDKCGKFYSDAKGENEIAENDWITPPEHRLTAHPAAAATCSAVGSRAYWSCDECGKLFSDAGGNNQVTAESLVTPVDPDVHAAFKEPVWTWTGNDKDGYTAATVTLTCSSCGEQKIIPGNVSKAYTYDSTVYTATATTAVGETLTATKTVAGQVCFVGNTLSLQGDIAVNFYLNLTAEQAAQGQIDFKWIVNGKENTSSFDLSKSQKPANNGYYKATCNIAPAEMSSDITATLIVDGQEVSTNIYSVSRYADVILNDADYVEAYVEQYGQAKYDALVDLIHAMFDYGTRAQERFEVDQDTLVNGGEYTFTDAVTPDMIPETKGVMEKDLSGYGLKYNGSSVVLLTNTTIRHYYLIEDQAKFNAVKDSVTFNGSPVTYTEKNGEIYFELSNIAARNLDKVYTLNIGGTEYTYSAFDYARSILSKTGSDANVKTQALVAAMHRYNQKAKVYFGEPIVEPERYEWNQTSATVRSYLENANYDPSDYSKSVIANYAPAERSLADERPAGMTFRIKQAGTLMIDGYSQHVEAGNFTAYNVVPNSSTTFAVTDDSGKIVQWGTLNPTHFLRQIKTPNSRNMRDLGGWACDGGTVKYGKIIRGGLVTPQDREILVNQYGVRTDIELRGLNDPDGNIPLSSPLGDDITYHVYNNYAWYHFTYKDLCKQIIRDAFEAVRSGDALYLHCGAGADRTATMVFILEAILGMSQSDMDMDYELTSFYVGGNNARCRNAANAWLGMINEIKGKRGATFRDKAVQCVLDLGISIDEINEFRANMIDGAPELLTVQ